MARTTTAGGAAAAALVVALGVASPAVAAPWPSPAAHSGESPGPSASPDGAHGDHDPEAATPEDHGDHDPEAATPEDHGAHGDHDSGTATPEDHSQHGSSTEEETGHEGGHGGEADTVSDQTRVSVLGGFGAVNAAVVGSAFLLRRRARRTGRQPRINPGSHR